MKFFLRLFTLLLFPALSLTAQVPELVNLGLSVKWASCNLGASNPKDFGFYYMWGETSPATDRECSWKSYSLANGDDNKLTKYIPDSLASKYGDNDFFDNKRVLDPEDDAAHVALGGKWRIPTNDEWLELHENCSWTWTQLNGIQGYKVTSLVDGFTDKSIFLPAAGCRSSSDISFLGSSGYYWSASLYEGSPYDARDYGFGERYRNWGGMNRCNGFSVRPVSD